MHMAVGDLPTSDFAEGIPASKRNVAPNCKTKGMSYLRPKEAGVKQLSKTMVSPAVPTALKGKWFSLSNLDRVVTPTFSSVILFYKHVLIERTFEEITNNLKSSLAKVLVEFYPLAGQLALRDDGLVDVFCSDDGAVFIEASVQSELTKLGGPQPMPALSGLELARLGFGPHYIPDQLKSVPVLVVQVTKFSCGSVAVAVNWHHTVADGPSGSHFLRSWSEVAAGEAISLPPNHNRTLLAPRTPLDPSLVCGYSQISRPDDILGGDKAVIQPPKLTSCNITRAAVKGLKERVTMEDREGRQFTSAEAVSAQLWRQFTKARAENVYGEPQDSTTRFFMFVDGRKRLNLPSGYFGNVICSACAVSTEKDISEKPLVHAANLIRNATRSISAEYFRSLIDWVEAQGTAPAKSEHVNSLGRDVAATFWTFFPLYDVNFGWAKPDFASRNSPPRPYIDGIAMMPSAEVHEPMVALLNLHADRMENLQRQHSFKSMLSM